MSRSPSDRAKQRRELNRTKERWAWKLRDLASRSASKCRKKGKDVQCLISVAEIEELGRRQGMRCYLSGIPFYLGAGVKHGMFPSLDRQDVNGSYSLSNCRLVAWAHNRGRGDMPVTEFLILLQRTVESFATAPFHAEYHQAFLPIVPNPLDTDGSIT